MECEGIVATGWCDDSGPASGLELKVTDNAISLEQGCRLLKALNLTQITGSGSSSGKTMNEEDLISEHHNNQPHCFHQQNMLCNQVKEATLSRLTREIKSNRENLSVLQVTSKKFTLLANGKHTNIFKFHVCLCCLECENQNRSQLLVKAVETLCGTFLKHLCSHMS